MNEASDAGGGGARAGEDACGRGRVIYASAILRGARWRSEWTTAAGRREEGARERASELRRRARRRGGKKVSAQKIPNAPSAFHNSYFLPSFALRYPYPPLPPASRPHPAAATVFLSSSCLVRPSAASVPLPPVARLLIRKVSEDEGSSVAKKFGYFAIPLVNKLRHTQYVLVRREASSQAGVKCSSRRNFLRLRYRLPALSPLN